VPSLFISDLHLSAREAVTAGLLATFLRGPAREAAHLYILGDLFDYWLGDDSLQLPFERQVADQLAELAGRGCQIHFMAGNRDFLAGPKLFAAAGMSGLAETTVCTIGDQPALLLHGDLLCTDDTAYWEFRNTVRAPEWQQRFLAQPLAVRQQQVEALRIRSEDAKRDKSEALMDVNAEAVATAFRQHGVTTMIHGHIHRQGMHEYRVDGQVCRRWVLGAWGSSASYLRCAGTDWSFRA
jgi:UDP-2,3-diacylglucosamine hydrolase